VAVLAEAGTGQSVNVVTALIVIGAGVVAAFLLPALAYLGAWLTAPHEMILAELGFLRSDVNAAPYKTILAELAAVRDELAAVRPILPSDPLAAPSRPSTPILEVNTDIIDMARVAVSNHSQLDALFRGEVGLIGGTTGSYDYPIPMKWESAKGAVALIPSGDTRYLELAELVEEASGPVSSVRLPAPGASEGLQLHFGKHHGAKITMAVRVTQVVQEGTGGVAHLKARLSLSEMCGPDGELWPCIDAEEGT
jgi:hypothetical protein